MAKHSLEKNKNNLFIIITKTILYIFIAFCVLYSIVIMAKKIINPGKIPDFFGYKNFVIVSGSMETTLNVGDIVFVKESEKIEKGDIIAFNENGAVITHRVEELVNEGGEIKYRTKGDANTVIDTKTVSSQNIEGKYCFKIPVVGKFIMFLQTKIGVGVILAVFLIIFILINKHNS